MAEASALWELLRQAADPAVGDVLKTTVETEPDRALSRINPLAFAAKHQLGEELVISTLVHAARIGLFDMAWNVLCPGCGGARNRGRAQDAQPYRIRLRPLRGGLLADARRTRRSHLHRQSEDPADRSPRSRHAFPPRVHAPDLLGLRSRASGRPGQHRG